MNVERTTSFFGIYDIFVVMSVGDNDYRKAYNRCGRTSVTSAEDVGL